MAVILVVDDERDVRLVMREVLEREGYEVRLAENGMEGLRMLDDAPADLLITDIIMPGIDGVTTMQRAREKHPDMPVIVITGGGNVAPMAYEPGAIKTSAFLASATKAGANVTLTKPFGRKELIDAVNRLLPDHEPAG
jgi:CheY-like chemotaxis protein